MLSEPIKLPVLFYTDEAQQMHELGIEGDAAEEIEVRYLYFYDIHLLMETDDPGQTVVVVGGEEYPVGMSLQRVMETIKKAVEG